jgi:hypothetical protein
MFWVVIHPFSFFLKKMGYVTEGLELWSFVPTAIFSFLESGLERGSTLLCGCWWSSCTWLNCDSITKQSLSRKRRMYLWGKWWWSDRIRDERRLLWFHVVLWMVEMLIIWTWTTGRCECWGGYDTIIVFTSFHNKTYFLSRRRINNDVSGILSDSMEGGFWQTVNDDHIVSDICSLRLPYWNGFNATYIR